ncbi:OprD family outer membrane porin [Sulfurimonas sp. SAG-AH-194-L11]|nr:OprD family outer membrane porin [Sulfurimonas sp. SAG-AH-194-L11]MDF1877504.1 OprD family outer membrane porin [Sulfurimonas sp. SAG-AH-194-L11]
MKYRSLAIILLSSALLATSEVSTLADVFNEASVSGNVKYYYIQTDKDNSAQNAQNTSAYANTAGGQLHFDSASLYGFRAGVAFMTTNPFLLGPNVDASIIGRDNGVRLGDGPSGDIASKGFSVLAEAYLAYDYKNMGIYLGREVIKTPLIDAKVVRLLPSAVEGVSFKYTLKEDTKLDVAYYSAFKQRTSDVFINIIKHALGDQTKVITGSDSGYVGMFGFNHKADNYSVKLYNYYASDFMNSLYMSGYYKMNMAETKLSLGAEYITQRSIGNAETYLKQNPSYAGGAISVNAIGLKTSLTKGSSKLLIAYSKVFKKSAKHDSLVLPWDGTPLFTNMITSNDLFQSNYGNALNADSIYIGGAQGIKLLYNQKYDDFGLKGFSTTLSYLNTSFDRVGFDKTQEDYNIVLQYKAHETFTLQLKGIWVTNDTSAKVDGSLNAQVKLLTQYRAIANYKF